MKGTVFKWAFVVFRYLYSYRVEVVGQAVCNTFIGQWFLFGIEAAATASYTGMRPLSHTSTPYGRCRRQQVKPTTDDRFTVWQMTLPSDSSVNFVPVVSHLAAVCGLNGSSQVDLSVNLSVLTLNDAEHSAAVSEDSRLHQLHLSCDECNCNNTCTLEQSAELSFTDEAAATGIVLTTPQTSPHGVRCLVGDGCAFPVHGSSLSCACDIWSSCLCDVQRSLVQPDSQLETLFSFHAEKVPSPVECNTESFELFDVIDSSHESATGNTVGCYSDKDFTAEVLRCSLVKVPSVSSVLKKTGSSICSSESSGFCSRCGASSDSMCCSCSNFAEHALNAEDNCHGRSLVFPCKQLADAAANNCEVELVCSCVSRGCGLETDSKDNLDNHFAQSEDEFSVIAGISTLDIDAITERQTTDTFDHL